MANTKSAKKAIRVQERKAKVNRPVRSSVKTAVTRARKLILDKDFDAAKEAVMQATRELDMAAQKGVIHPNNAARRKSRLVKQLNDAVAGGGTKAKTTRASKTSKASKATKTTKSAKTTEAAKPDEATKAAETTEPAKPDEAAKAAETTEPAKADEADDATKAAETE